ncbi:MAG: hypothetical protein AVDCRST_MAG88-3949 [uncultured Thermomicrobiales bacterium]|uniref:Phage shock protein PspC N-terminal domain-containing protein n=1 Tax=uncultured Thermomicrobiales bacterium TaxID=1645740 RepID=A0A6J4VRQ7_9BACT|nr:MAG: hypothetical protein AVDCRST_MAG88-3949 [uncultured Thermomicrobiales bacterium]
MNETIGRDATGRRLTRSRRERMLTGVCGGLAEHLEVDPTLVRILTVALALTTGPVIPVAYVALALIMPAAPDEARGPQGPVAAQPF